MNSLELTVSATDFSGPRTSASETRLTDAERQPCEVWTRVMGYHRPVASFNTGKKAEHADRLFFHLGK